jgi:integrase
MGRVFLRGKIWYIDTCYRGKRVRSAAGPDKKEAIKDGLIIIQDSKSKEKRIIYMNDTTKGVFLNLLSFGGKEYVFENKNGGKYTKDYITHLFGKIVKQAGIKDFRFHDLRHTFASRLVMSGVNLKTIQELLGHKDYRMSLRYSHLSPEIKKQAVKILDKDKNMAQRQN